MIENIKRVAVFTSGGDAPGMNAAIRAVVRTASYYDMHVYGIIGGYEGMINGNIKRLDRRTVGNIIQKGGTILKTSRSKAFMTPEGRKQAYEALQAYDIDALIAIGGNGTFTGAKVFFEEYGVPTIGVPGTIDNDIFGTDYTIGFDTAVNTAVEAVDKIRDTADSHNRIFFVEVMGRHSGFIALNTGIGSGAGAILIPEYEMSVDDIISMIKTGVKRKKLFSLILVAEGNKIGPTQSIADQVSQAVPAFETKVTIIGHLQRGGSPTAMDRLLASRLGFGAVEALLNGQQQIAIGVVNEKIAYTPLEEAITGVKPPNQDLVRMAEILSM